MAPENKIKEGMIANMSNRQKIMAVVLVVILIFVGWQVIGLFGSDSGEITPKPQQAPQQITAAQPNGAAPQQGAQGAMPQVQPQPINQPPPPPPQPVPRDSATSSEAQLLETQKKNEEKYVDALNQLQMLKIQRDIAETNQAIAAARLATVTAEKNASDLLTKPIVQIAPLPPGAYAASLENPVTSGANATNVPPPPVEEQAVPVEPPYQVISVSMQMGRWSAVIGYQGKLFNVSVGDVLPVDGSVVASISKNGVILMKEGKRRKVSIITTI